MIPNPNPSAFLIDPKRFLVQNARQSHVAPGDWREEIFLRADGRKAAAKRKQVSERVNGTSGVEELTIIFRRSLS